MSGWDARGGIRHPSSLTERRGTLDLEIEDEAALRERAARLFVGIFLGAVSLGFVLLTALLGWSGVFSAG